MPTALPRVLQRLLSAVQLAMVVVLLALVVVLLAGTVPSFFGAESYVVLSGSMAPTMQVGDLAIVTRVKPQDFEPGDVITYRVTENPDIVVTHRLVGKSLDEQGRLLFETRGDANESSDQVAVAHNAVLGRVAFSIPRLGYFVDFARKPEGKLLLIAVPASLLALDYLRGSRRKRPAPSAVREGAADLLARGRLALSARDSQAALELFDRAIAADPHLDEAWLLKAGCLPAGPDQVACLRAALTVNPDSARVKQALELATAAASTAVAS